MKPLHSTLRWPVLSALALSSLLAACGRQRDDELAANQRLDDATNEVRQAAQDVRRDAQQANVDAQVAANQAAETTARVSADMAITAKVNAALVGDDQLKASQINVDTRDGSVTLSGKAPDANARERATTLASNITGVKQVNNRLVVAAG